MRSSVKADSGSSKVNKQIDQSLYVFFIFLIILLIFPVFIIYLLVKKPNNNKPENKNADSTSY